MPTASNYRLVVCDLDGTLVGHDLNVSSQTLAVLHHLNQSPVHHLVLATGRMHPSALVYAQEMHLTDEPLISYQGAMVRPANNEAPPLFHTPIPQAVGHAIARQCQADGLHLNSYIDDRLHTPPHPRYVEEYRRTARIEPAVVESLLPLLETARSTKMVVIERDEAKITAMRRTLEAQFEGQVTLCLSRPHFLEITAVGVNKWSAVEQVAQHYGIPQTQVLCIGDQENDLSMIAQAGCGVAMGNAPAHVQAQADEVTGPIEAHGAADAIARLVLGQPLDAFLATLPALPAPIKVG